MPRKAEERSTRRNRIDMDELVSPLEADQVSAIATISEKLKLPFGEVREIYKREFERLAMHARIPNFLTVLTMRNVQSILRGVGKRAALS
jgi:uncharacterized protein (DUF2126 family)